MRAIEAIESLAAQDGDGHGLEDCHMRLLKADEVAEALQVPKPRVYELARQHALPAVRIGRQLRFREEAIETWLAALEDHGAAVHTERL